MRRGTYEKYANPLQGCLFLVLHLNVSVSLTGSRSRENVVLGGEDRCASLTLEFCLSPPSQTRNTLKPMGTGSSRGPRSRGMGAQMCKCSTRTNASENEHFYPVPVCFGVIREFMQHPLGGYGVFGGGIECTSRGECCSPSFPSGFPPPLVKSSVLLKCGIYFSSFLIEFESRIEIIERRTV